MKPFFVINRMTLKPGMVDQFLAARRSFRAGSGLVANRTYRSVDGKSLVFVSQFESLAAWEQIRDSESFKESLRSLREYVEKSEPGEYEEVSMEG